MQSIACIRRLWIVLLVLMPAARASAYCEIPTLLGLLKGASVIVGGKVTSLGEPEGHTQLVNVSIERSWLGPRHGVLSFRQISKREEDDRPVKLNQKMLVWGYLGPDGKLTVQKGCYTPIDFPLQFYAQLVFDLKFGTERKFSEVMTGLNEALKKQDFETAEYLLVHTNLSNPDEEGQRRFQLAHVYAMKKNFVLAAQNADLAVRLSPNIPVARFNLACYLTRVGNSEMAIRTVADLVTWLKGKDDVTRNKFYSLLSKDPDLNAIRKREDFQKYLRMLNP